MMFGIASNTGNPFTGYLSNIQIYNSELSSNSISELYNEGIGGAPIDLQSLIGWWPLNGNAKDYSSENIDGSIVKATFTDQWTRGYTPP